MTMSVLHFMVCDRVRADPVNLQSLNIDGLKWSIRSMHTPPFPLVLPRLTVLAIVMGGEGDAEFYLQIKQANPSKLISRSRKPHRIRFFGGAQDVIGMKGFIQNCTFPKPGLYWVELVFSDNVIARQPLRVYSEVSHGEGKE